MLTKMQMQAMQTDALLAEWMTATDQAEELVKYLETLESVLRSRLGVSGEVFNIDPIN